MKYVIIGNSTAAVGAAEGIRSVDKTGEIVMISKEKEHTYSRPLISYLLCGKTTTEKMRYRPDDFYVNNNIRLVFGEVVRIDPKSKNVFLCDGSKIDYDKLLDSSGSRPFVPPMDGLDAVENKFTFMCLDDARRLEKALGQEKKVLIIGAGLIGLKCAEGLYNKVKSITIVDLSERVLPSILTEDASKIIQSHLEQSEIKLVLGDSVRRFAPGSAMLKSGEEIPFDILILAVGVRPNTELIRDAGGDVGRGIITNDFLETTLPDVYSAGDCTESADISSGTQKVLAILPNAYMQGECAGINMAGGRKKYENAIPMNAIGFLGLHMITAGSYDGTPFSCPVSGSGDYRRLYVKDGRLIGFIMIGDVKRAGIYTSILKNKVPLDSLDMDLLIDRPQLVSFSKEYRKEKLGGIKNGH